MKTKTILSTFILSSLLAATAPAATYLFDFGSGPVAAGAFGISTNMVTPVNATFGPTTLTLTASASPASFVVRDRGANTGPASDITRDLIQWQTGDPITITISGLAASQEYGFIIWSGDFSANQIKTTDHTVAGSSGGGTIQHTSVAVAAENAAVGTSLHQVTLPNVVSTPGGTLTYTIDYVSGGGAATTLNGMQITVIPEPSAALLGGLGLLALLRRRR